MMLPAVDLMPSLLSDKPDWSVFFAMGTPRLLAIITAATVLCHFLSSGSGFLVAPLAPSAAGASCRSLDAGRSWSSRYCATAATKRGRELWSAGGGTTEKPPEQAKEEGEGAEDPPSASASSSRAVARKKADLMRLILDTSIEEKESAGAAEKVDAIIGELETLQQGFREDSVDGEWVLCFTRNSEGSPSLQKALPGDRGFQNFDVQAKQFSNIVRVWGGKVKVVADVGYQVQPEEPNKLISTIVGAGVNLGPVRVPLPLTGRVGYLEFTYQDDDIRVTRGNRGGLFLHMRPGSAFPLNSEDEEEE